FPDLCTPDWAQLRAICTARLRTYRRHLDERPGQPKPAGLSRASPPAHVVCTPAFGEFAS
ncbi:MAG: hypothetical protein AAFR23_09905, partial [Pseudomonadota bacterium]